MAFKDHFSGHASAYARYRPDYPKELFDYLATLTPRHEVALDCATGSGQAAIGLARHYDCVVATDGSVAQLKNAQAHPHVAYLGNLAEQPALQDAERRPCRRGAGGALVRSRALPSGDAARAAPGRRARDLDLRTGVRRAADRCRRPLFLRRRRRAVLAAGAPPRRERLSRSAVSVARSQPCRNSSCASTGTLDDFIGYVSTWSATQRYTKVSGADPLPTLTC